MGFDLASLVVGYLLGGTVLHLVHKRLLSKLEHEGNLTFNKGVDKK